MKNVLKLLFIVGLLFVGGRSFAAPPTNIYFELNPTTSLSYIDQSIAGDLGQTSSLSFGDLNGDGRKDIYVANLVNQQNRLWINNGDGTFLSKDITGDNGYNLFSTIADFDGDGNNDIYVTAQSGVNRLWLNDGSANFTSKNVSSHTNYARGVASADVDGDGDVDLYLAQHDGTNQLWLNDGNANFTLRAIPGNGDRQYGATFGDIDGDGDLDLHTVSYFVSQNRFWINDGSGNFSARSYPIDTSAARESVMADFNKDGDLDVYVTVHGGGGQNYFLMSDGSGDFTRVEVAGDAFVSVGVQVIDLNGDSNLDVLVPHYGGINKVLLGDGSGNFSIEDLPSLATAPSMDIIASDFNQDGKIDFYTANYSNNQNKLWISNGEYANTITLNENQTTISNLKSVDQDSADTHSYQLVSGTGDTDNGLFTLTSAGVLSFTSAPDFENPSDNNTDNEYEIRVETNDGNGGLFEKALLVSVEDVFEPVNMTPTDITLSTEDINENNALGAFSTLNAVDPNSGDTFTFTLGCVDPGSDDSSFSITGNQLHASEVFDFETKDSYEICIRVEDQDGLHFEKDFTISINNIDESIPTITLNGDSSITIYLGETYTEQGATAQDLEDGDISSSIVISGDTVDTTTVGEYIIRYDVQDGANNDAVQVTRTVFVIKKKDKKSSKRVSASKLKEIFGTDKEEVKEETKEETKPSTEENPLGGEQCASHLLITNNMKKGDRDGKHSSYNKGVVTQVSLLQTHMNRILQDQYGNLASGPVDGIYGKLTKKGVERLQDKLNTLLKEKITPLVIDGIVGPYTKKAINHSC